MTQGDPHEPVLHITQRRTGQTVQRLLRALRCIGGTGDGEVGVMAARNATKNVVAAVSKTGLMPSGYQVTTHVLPCSASTCWRYTWPPMSDRRRAGHTQRTLRSGLIALKKGMTAAWDQNGARHALTLVQVQQCQVVQVKTQARDGYNALQVGAGDKAARKCNKPELLHFQAHGVLPKARVHEFRVSEDAILPSGTTLNARHFVPGQYVDVTGVSIGKGFQGAMKRWGFKGQPATHGTSRTHRSLGSTGHRKTPGRTFKGKKMHGHMGVDQVTVMGVLVFGIDVVNNVIALKGSVPGHANNYIYIRDAVRLRHWLHNQKLEIPPPVPTSQEDLEGQDHEEAQEGVMLAAAHIIGARNPFEIKD